MSDFHQNAPGSASTPVGGVSALVTPPTLPQYSPPTVPLDIITNPAVAPLCAGSSNGVGCQLTLVPSV